MDWITATRTFCLVVEKGSFTGAGKLENTSSSAISKRLDWLEKELSVTLLIRTTRHIALTEAGTEYYPKAKGLMKQFDALKNETMQDSLMPTGLLKLSAPLSVGSNFLMPHIKEFLAHYPELRVQLDILPLGQNPGLDHDLVFCKKINSFDSANHKGLAISEYGMGMYASPTYLQQHEPITQLDDLQHHNMILYGNQKMMGSERLNNGEELIFERHQFSSDNIDALLYAAINGMGITFAPTIFIQQEIASKQLVPVLPNIQTLERQLWCFYPKTEFMPLKSRLFLDFIKQRVRIY